MKKAFVLSAAAFIAIGAAVSSSTKANAEDNASGVAHIIQPAPVPPSAAPPEQAYYYRPYYHRRYDHRPYYLIIDVTITIAAITENLTTRRRFLMIMLGCRCNLVWHRGRKGNGDGKANHGNDKRGYYNSG